MGDTLPIKRTRTSRKQVVYPELSDEQMYFVKKAVEGNKEDQNYYKIKWSER